MSRKQTYCLLSPPLPGAANIRSVHTAGSARGNLPQVSPPCSGHTPTDGGFVSFSIASRIYLPSILCSVPATTHQRYYDASDSRWALVPTGSPSFLHTTFLPFHPQPPYGSRHRFNTLPLSVTSFLAVFRQGLGFAIHMQARHTIRPKRVRHPTDRQFAFRCFPPRLAATQLRSATGRRAYARKGLGILSGCSSLIHLTFLIVCHWRRTCGPPSGG
jgi:hypothetical protein